MRAPLRISLLVVACALVLVAAGCGNGGGLEIVYDSVPDTTTSLGATESVPAPELGPWTDVTGNLTGMPTECGELYYVAGEPGTDRVIAGVAGQGLWVSSPASPDWTKLGSGDQVQITNRAATIVFDPDVPNQFWESGHYQGPGAFRTTDNGATFQPLGNVGHLDGLSVDLSDSQRKTMLAGSHESPDALWLSKDSGETWENIAIKLPSGIGFMSQPLIVDSQVMLLGTYSDPIGAGIFRSSDGGQNWIQVDSNAVTGPPLVTKDGIYWPVEGGGLVRSDDNGATWMQMTGDGLLSSYNVVQLSDGRLATVGEDHAIVSADRGATWEAIGPPLPGDAYGVAYSEGQNAIFTWQWDCGGGNVVPPGSVQRLDLTPPTS